MDDVGEGDLVFNFGVIVYCSYNWGNDSVMEFEIRVGVGVWLSSGITSSICFFYIENVREKCLFTRCS
jgi:hypothetical protein